MEAQKQAAIVCQICKLHKKGTLIPAQTIRPSLLELILKDHPDWSPDGYICKDDLDIYRARYVEESLEAEKGELSQLEEDVVEEPQRERSHLEEPQHRV